MKIGEQKKMFIYCYVKNIFRHRIVQRNSLKNVFTKAIDVS